MLRIKVFSFVKSQIHIANSSRHPLYTLVRPTPIHKLSRNYAKISGPLLSDKNDRCPPSPPCPPPPCGDTFKECKTSNATITAKTPPQCEPKQCEKPQCAYEPSQDEIDKRRSRRLVLGLLAAAGTLFLIYKFFPFSSQPAAPRQDVKVLNKKGKHKRCTEKFPVSSDDIPREVPYLLIGGGTASFAAFRSIKALDPKAKVLMITDECDYPYMRPPLSKELWLNDDPEKTQKLLFKQYSGAERSLLYEPADFYIRCEELQESENGGMAVARGWSIVEIDPYEKKAYLENGKAIRYGNCLIATGANPKSLDVFDHAPQQVKEKVLLYRGVDDFMELSESMGEAEAIAIVGGGFLGSELACALARKAKSTNNKVKIYQIFKEPGHMHKVLPDYLSRWTTKKVVAEGVDVMQETEIEDVQLLPKDSVKLILKDGKEVRVNKVVLAVGVEPNTSLAVPSGLEIARGCGGYLVNAELEVRSNLYAAGDCASFYDIKLGRRRVEHHDHAVVSGRLAGENMVGAAKPYLHQSMFWSDLGPDVGYEAIGVVDACLPTVGVFAKSSKKDVPKPTTEGDGVRSDAEAAAPPVKASTGDEKIQAVPAEEYDKGVIFYLRNEMVVGVVLWNVFNRLSVARQVLADERKYDDLNEVAKLFNIHDEDLE